MKTYTKSELEDAKGAIQSSVRKIEKVLETLSKRNPPPKSQITLAKRNLKVMRLSLELIERELDGVCGN